MTTVVVVGLGYVGLPLAMRAAEVGHRVVGYDVDEARVKSLEAGESYVEDVPSGELKAALAGGMFRPSADPSVCAGFDVAVVAAPTPLRDGLPDLTYLEDSARTLSGYLRSGATVVIESTSYPGTTQEKVLPLLEEGSGLVAGRDFHLGFSPERIDPGNTTWTLVTTPKIVSGIDEASLEVIKAFYDTIVDRTVVVSSPREAELAKLVENTFRHVNIALVNELAIMCRRLGLSVWEIIDAAATKPFGFMPFYPGPGIGGHCLPSDPYYLSWRARMMGYEARFIAFADEINGGMPAYTVQLVADALNDQGKPLKGSRILALGVAYKPGVGDVRDSPAVEIIDALLLRGARVDYADPHVPALTVGNRRLEAVPWAAADLASYDLVAVLTAHRQFEPVRLCREARLVIDTRNLTGPVGVQPHVIRL